jgi:hypothetical protein
METVTIYLIKSSTLLLVFYSTYYFLLKKNTFFTTNRWFLLFGILCAAVLPLLSFQKTVWVEPAISNTQSINFADISENPINVPSLPLVETTDISWEMIVGLLYGIGVLFFLTQLLIELYSLRKIIRRKDTIEADGFTFIEVDDAISPFSFFKKIVYNRNLFQPEELNNIIEHEKIHAKRLHSLDVLIARIHCILFWWNPLVWLYKKAMIQNLEFIADQNALSQIKNKKFYLLTLLKITTSEHQVPLANHFYQSLIKKRILMLNTNKSKKYHSWKYLVVVPALALFMWQFQTKVVAQEKKSTIVSHSSSTTIRKEVTAKSTDAELKELERFFKEQHNVTLKFSKVKRNKSGEIISLKADIESNANKDHNKSVYRVSGAKPIDGFTVFKYTNSKGKEIIGFVDPSTKFLIAGTITINDEAAEVSPVTIVLDSISVISEDAASISGKVVQGNYDPNKKLKEKVVVGSYNNVNQKVGSFENKAETFGFEADAKKQHLKNHFDAVARQQSNIKKNIFINRKGPLEETDELPEGVLMVLNGKVISKEEMQKLDANSIKSFTVVKRGSNKLKKYEELFKKYGESAKNGIFAIITEEIQKPVEKDNSGWGMDYKTSSPEDNIANIIENKTVDYKKALITLNGKEITAAEMEKINPKSIETVTVSGGVTNADFITMYGEKSRYGVIQIEKYGHKSPTSRDKNAIKGKDIILDPENGSFTIHRRSQKNDFKFYKKYLSQIDVELTISGVKRNAEGLITFINIQLIDSKNNQKIDSNGTAFENENGITDISIGRKNGKMILAPQ